MEEQILLSAIEQLARQNTPDEIQEVLERYPGLLTQSTFLALQRLAVQAANQGDSESSRFFNEMAAWLQGLAEEITASVVATNPIVQLVQQVLARAISLDDAFVRLRSPAVIREYNDGILTTLDNLTWSLRDTGQHQPAFVVARLNFEAARNSATTELSKYSGITLLQNMPTTPQFAELRAQVCEITEQWLERADDPALWAGLMVEYGNALVEIATGDIAENVERAIECYQDALNIRTQSAVSHEWATTILNLGSAYVKRTRGDPQDNLEHAIACYQQSLQILSRETTPSEWATAMNALGVAYLRRIKESKADNTEQAIKFLDACVQVHTFEDFPAQWAMAQNNLGIAYGQRTQGDSAQNKELAIQHHEAALRVYTAGAFPVEWARTHHNLGLAHLRRITGEPKANIERAIECFTECRKALLREKNPSAWAEAQHHLGTAFFKRISGERAENLETAVACFESALTVRTRDEFPDEWALTMMNLGAAYAERIRGEKSQNLERAISSLELALEVCTLEKSPYEWAIAMDNLASAFRERVSGDRAANIEQAIAYFQEALRVRTPEAYPRDWAITTDHLALAYQQRIRGERVDNIEHAIRLLESALEVLKREDFRLDWARTTSNLSLAFAERIAGDKAKNIERSIECCREALKVVTRDKFALDWALTMLNLGAIYGERLVGKRTENLEQAIEHLKAALQMLTRQAFPREWSFIQYNLGNNYRNRILGDHAENLERAIECYEASLQVRTAETLPQQWATSMHSLGVAYYFRAHGKRSENIERAIECYRATLQVRTREAFPREWARATHDLGLAFSDREQGDEADNIDQAITLLENAATVHTREAFPYEWIMEMQSLGDAYTKRTAGDRNDNLDRAIEYYETSLKLCTREALPQQWATTMLRLGLAFSNRSRGEGLSDKLKAMEYLRLAAETHLELGLPYETNESFSALGDVAFTMQRYEDARNAYSRALEQVETIRAEALSLKRRAAILQANTRLFDRSIIALMKMGHDVEALELAERGKSRTLSDLLTLRDLRPKNTPSQTLDEYEQMLFRVRALEDLLRAAGEDRMTEGKPFSGTTAQQQHLEQIRSELLDTQRQLEELVNVIRRHDKDFLPHAKPLTAEDIKRLASEANATLILFRVTEEGSFVFLVFPDGDTSVVQTPEFTTDHLNQLLIRRDDDGTTHGWALDYYVYKSAMTRNKKALAQEAFQVWLETMDSMLGAVYEELLKPVHQLLKNKLGNEVSSIVLIPNRGLSILPLHACWWNKDSHRRYLLDDFVVSYAPSLSVFQRCLEREHAGRKKYSVLGIANPVPPGNLPFSEFECAEIERLLGHDRCLILSREQATKEAVMQYAGQSHWLHFSCHGRYQLDAPFESSLLLANKESLSLAEILERLDLRHTWLTVLSACETGLVDFREISDEHYGLPIGFLFAGAPTVWGTLWTVNDLTTAMLMVKAYDELINAGNTKAKAIREAQLWLRDMPAVDFETLIQERQAQTSPDAMVLVRSTRLNDKLDNITESKECPFAHPYYWAGMQSIGA